MKLVLVLAILATACHAQELTAEEIASKRKAEIVALIRQIQTEAKEALAEAAEARAGKAAINEVVRAQAERLVGMGGLKAQLDAAEGATKVLQDAMDALRVQVRELERMVATLTADVAKEREAKAKWMERANKLMFAVAGLAAAWLFGLLKFLPLPYRLAACAGAALLVYGGLYAVL